MNLNDNLSDISRGLVPTVPMKPSPVERGDYGDFEIGQTDGGRPTFNPISDAAIKWCVEKLPEHLDRHGTRAYIIDADELTEVVAGAERDNLISCSDWEKTMNELDERARQWENLE